MNDWNDTVILVKKSIPEKDPDGFPEQAEERKTEVYCDVNSVTRTEFYQAKQAGIKAELMITVHDWEYDGEQYAEYDGDRYEVIRTYKKKAENTIVLTLGENQ